MVLKSLDRFQPSPSVGVPSSPFLHVRAIPVLSLLGVELSSIEKTWPKDESNIETNHRLAQRTNAAPLDHPRARH